MAVSVIALLSFIVLHKTIPTKKIGFLTYIQNQRVNSYNDPCVISTRYFWAKTYPNAPKVSARYKVLLLVITIITVLFTRFYFLLYSYILFGTIEAGLASNYIWLTFIWLFVITLTLIVNHPTVNGHLKSTYGNQCIKDLGWNSPTANFKRLVYAQITTTLALATTVYYTFHKPVDTVLNYTAESVGLQIEARTIVSIIKLLNKEVASGGLTAAQSSGVEDYILKRDTTAVDFALPPSVLSSGEAQLSPEELETLRELDAKIKHIIKMQPSFQKIEEKGRADAEKISIANLVKLIRSYAGLDD